MLGCYRVEISAEHGQVATCAFSGSFSGGKVRQSTQRAPELCATNLTHLLRGAFLSVGRSRASPPLVMACCSPKAPNNERGRWREQEMPQTKKQDARCPHGPRCSADIASSGALEWTRTSAGRGGVSVSRNIARHAEQRRPDRIWSDGREGPEGLVYFFNIVPYHPLHVLLLVAHPT